MAKKTLGAGKLSQEIENLWIIDFSDILTIEVIRQQLELVGVTDISDWEIVEAMDYIAEKGKFQIRAFVIRKIESGGKSYKLLAPVWKRT